MAAPLITIDSTDEQIRLKAGVFFPDLTKARIAELKQRFRELDDNGNGVLEFFEVKLMFEKAGEPKTHMEARKIISECDSTGTETINFGDFLRCIALESGDAPINLFGRIATSGLAKTATFFEQKMREGRGKSKEEVEAEIKREAAVRKEEREEKKKELERVASKKSFADLQSKFH